MQRALRKKIATGDKSRSSAVNSTDPNLSDAGKEQITANQGPRLVDRSQSNLAQSP
jgi:hypothetical protein